MSTIKKRGNEYSHEELLRLCNGNKKMNLQNDTSVNAVAKFSD